MCPAATRGAYVSIPWQPPKYEYSISARGPALDVVHRIALAVVRLERLTVVCPRDRDVDRDGPEVVVGPPDGLAVEIRRLLSRDLRHRVAQTDADDDEREDNTLGNTRAI